LKKQLNDHQSLGLWRTHKIRSGPQSNNFNSNDYLGMSNHPDVIQAFKQAVDQYGVGSGSAHTLSGYTKAHDELREQLKDWLGCDDVLLFSSGYQANLALLTTLISPSDHIFADKLNHASLIDGMLFSKAKFTRYSHLDIDKIRSGAACCASQHWIITESLFSMDGDEVDLKKLATFSDRAILIIDEAHSLGLYGPEGAGLIAANNLTQQQAPIMIGTFGKSIGTQGAFIAGDQVYIDALMQFARPYLFTTAMAPALAAASTASIKLIRTMDEERAYLFSLIHYFREQAVSITLGNSSSPIQPILFNDISLVNRLSERLSPWGISSIRYPTVFMDAPRLRITLTVNHTKEYIAQFFEHLQEALDEETSHASCL
jgi:8-amino-7-oxononanoate synthase